MPDLNGTACYREVWLETHVDLVGEHYLEWADTIAAWTKRWSTAVAQQAKGDWKGRITHRAMSMWLGEDSFIHFKVMVVEDYPGHADPLVDYLAEVMGATDRSEKRYQAGASAIAQHMEDSSMSLVGAETWEHFAAWWLTIRAQQRSYQPYGVCFNLLRAVKAEKPLCDVDGCGLPLRFVLSPSPAALPAPALADDGGGFTYSDQPTQAVMVW